MGCLGNIWLSQWTKLGACRLLMVYHNNWDTGWYAVL